MVLISWQGNEQIFANFYFSQNYIVKISLKVKRFSELFLLDPARGPRCLFNSIYSNIFVLFPLRALAKTTAEKSDILLPMTSWSYSLTKKKENLKHFKQDRDRN